MKDDTALKKKRLVKCGRLTRVGDALRVELADLLRQGYKNSTLPPTNIAPAGGTWKINFLLKQPSVRCYVSWREGSSDKN